LIENHVDLNSFVKSIQVNVFVADKELNLVYMNDYARKTLKSIEPAIKAVFQVSVADMEGASIHRFHRDPKRVEAILKTPLALPHKADFEFGGITLRTNINAVWDDSGQLEAYVVNWEDVTSRDQLEGSLNLKLLELGSANQELQKRNRQIEQDEAELKVAHEELNKTHAYLNIKMAQLKQSNQDLESFATIASHDLMAPVRKIINFAESLHENGSHCSGDDKLLLEKILLSGERMRLLITDILDYSRLAGHSFVFERINLNDVLSEVLAILADQILYTGAKVIIAGELPVIDANKTQMIQLLQNLISNALKYRKEDTAPVLKISATQTKEFALVALEDNGIGIKDEHKDLVFQPFERLNPAVEGTGMGLAICKKVVVSHGGEISVQNLPEGIGSVFNIKLPVRHNQ